MASSKTSSSPAPQKGRREASALAEVAVAGGTTLDGSALIAPADVRAVRVVNTAGKQFTTVNI